MSRTNHHGDKNKLKLFGENWAWYTQEPKIWRKLHKHRKRRQSVRQCKHEVMRGGEPNWPHDKKPWIYYW